MGGKLLQLLQFVVVGSGVWLTGGSGAVRSLAVALSDHLYLPFTWPTHGGGF